jgi:acyl carrier protein phosphodiesterase
MIADFIADFIKGKNKYNFKDAIQNGICFHKAIDNGMH